MKFNSTSKTRGDCTASYDVTDFKAKTVGEFIQEVLNEKRDEWGEISVDGLQICEYKHGTLLAMPKEIKEMYLNREITKISANGGWTRMDYTIITKPAEVKVEIPKKDIVIEHGDERFKLEESKHTIICKIHCAICERLCNSLSDRICERLGGGKRSYFRRI